VIVSRYVEFPMMYCDSAMAFFALGMMYSGSPGPIPTMLSFPPVLSCDGNCHASFHRPSPLQAPLIPMRQARQVQRRPRARCDMPPSCLGRMGLHRLLIKEDQHAAEQIYALEESAFMGFLLCGCIDPDLFPVNTRFRERLLDCIVNSLPRDAPPAADTHRISTVPYEDATPRSAMTTAGPFIAWTGRSISRNAELTVFVESRFRTPAPNGRRWPQRNRGPALRSPL